MTASPPRGSMSRMLVRARLSVSVAGPAFLVAVGYIDPGNWGTDIAAGSEFGYSLLWVLLLANVTALFLQYLSAKLGIASGQHLAQLLGAAPPATRLATGALAAVTMVATETAEFLGVVIGLRLLFGLDPVPAIVAGAGAVLGLLMLGGNSRRRLEICIFVLLGTVAGVYVYELWLAQPAAGDIAFGLLPRPMSPEAIPLGAAIIGATVMPHNLFLHSGLMVWQDPAGVPARTRLRRSTIETVVALNCALFVNAAILIMAAVTLMPQGRVVEELDEAKATLAPVLGPAAAAAFALALLSAGLASTITGGVAGQFIIEGFTRLRPPLLLRRLATMIPAMLVIVSGVNEVKALVASQVVLSLALPTTAYFLVRFTNNPALMGELVNRRSTIIVARVVLAALVAVNLALLLALLAG
jgi:manganese transport protein